MLNDEIKKNNFKEGPKEKKIKKMKTEFKTIIE
jgi:hypothetical protein